MVVLTKTKIALAAVLIAGASSAAMAQKTDATGPSNVNAAAQSPVTLATFHASSRRERVRHSRNARLDTYAPAQDAPPVSVVGPDNYKYWTEACCF